METYEKLKKDSELDQNRNTDYFDEKKKSPNFSSDHNLIAKSLKLLPDHVVKSKLRSALLEILYTRNNNISIFEKNNESFSKSVTSINNMASPVTMELKKMDLQENFFEAKNNCIAISEILNNPKIKEIFNQEKNASNLFHMTITECLKKEFLIKKEGVFAKEEYYLINWITWDNIFKKVSDKLKGFFN